MSEIQKNIKSTEQDIWLDFAKKYELSEAQLDQFKVFATRLQEWNEVINLTNITKLTDIIYYHFEDSLEIAKFIDLNKVSSICDIGTGGGFPGLPLKIKYPHLNVVLIEVNNKKINFLENLIQEFAMQNVEIYNLDWRTFIRKTSYSLELFLSRASLHTDELMRLFKPSSPYKDSKLVYWAATTWVKTKDEEEFYKKEEIYKVGNKRRKLIFFNK